MIEYRKKIRRQTPQTIQYTFKDHNKSIIPLTDYAVVVIEAKCQDQVMIATDAEFQDKSLGTVISYRFKFPTIGVWDVQFYCVDHYGDRLYGEPLQLRVVKNVDDLDAGEITNY